MFRAIAIPKHIPYRFNMNQWPSHLRTTGRKGIALGKPNGFNIALGISMPLILTPPVVHADGMKDDFRRSLESEFEEAEKKQREREHANTQSIYGIPDEEWNQLTIEEKDDLVSVQIMNNIYESPSEPQKQYVRRHILNILKKRNHDEFSTRALMRVASKYGIFNALP